MKHRLFFFSLLLREFCPSGKENDTAQFCSQRYQQIDSVSVFLFFSFFPSDGDYLNIQLICIIYIRIKVVIFVVFTFRSLWRLAFIRKVQTAFILRVLTVLIALPISRIFIHFSFYLALFSFYWVQLHTVRLGDWNHNRYINKFINKRFFFNHKAIVP